MLIRCLRTPPLTLTCSSEDAISFPVQVLSRLSVRDSAWRHPTAMKWHQLDNQARWENTCYTDSRTEPMPILNVALQSFMLTVAFTTDAKPFWTQHEAQEHVASLCSRRKLWFLALGRGGLVGGFRKGLNDMYIYRHIYTHT